MHVEALVFSAVLSWISSIVAIFYLQRYRRRAFKAEAELARRPNSIELEDFLHDLSLHGRGVVQISALRINEILLRARPEF